MEPRPGSHSPSQVHPWGSTAVEQNSRQNCLLWVFFSFSFFFAEHTVLNLNKWNIQFSKQINSFLKILHKKKKSLSLCNQLFKCFYTLKIRFLLNLLPLESASFNWSRVTKAPLSTAFSSWTAICRSVFPLHCEFWGPCCIPLWDLAQALFEWWDDERMNVLIGTKWLAPSRWKLNLFLKTN